MASAPIVSSLFIVSMNSSLFSCWILPWAPRNVQTELTGHDNYVLNENNAQPGKNSQNSIETRKMTFCVIEDSKFVAIFKTKALFSVTYAVIEFLSWISHERDVDK